MNQFFSDPQTLVRLQVGPLGTYLAPYAARLHTQQFTRQWAREQIRLAAHFSRWLDQRQVTAAEVTLQHAQDYLRFRTRHGTRPRRGAAAPLTRLLDLLQRWRSSPRRRTRRSRHRPPASSGSSTSTCSTNECSRPPRESATARSSASF